MSLMLCHFNVYLLFTMKNKRLPMPIAYYQLVFSYNEQPSLNYIIFLAHTTWMNFVFVFYFFGSLLILMMLLLFCRLYFGGNSLPIDEEVNVFLVVYKILLNFMFQIIQNDWIFYFCMLRQIKFSMLFSWSAWYCNIRFSGVYSV